MKCPNCSFMNPDRSVMCKICGYEFDKNTSISNDDDSEIEVTFDTLFGVHSNPRKAKNPLDKSKDKKRVPHDQSYESETSEEIDTPHQVQMPESDLYEAQDFDSKMPESNETVLESTDHASSILRPHTPAHESAPQSDHTDQKINPTMEVPLDENGDVIDIELVKTGDIHNDFYSSDETVLDSDDFKQNSKKVTMLLLTVIVLMIALALVFMTTRLKPDPSASEPGTNVTEPVDNTENNSSNPQDADVINTSPSDTIKAFFNELPDYVNNDSISFSLYFENPQSALGLLATFKNKGPIDKVGFDITDTVESETTTITASSTIERTIDNKHTISQDQWQFEVVLVNNQWLIKEILLNDDKSTATDSNTDIDTDTPSSSTSDTPSSSSTITPIKPEGFVKSGSFSGGIITDGQDISAIRYGNHDQFERLVIDLTQWQQANADGTSVSVNEACHYEASISEDGLKVNIILSGVRAASAVVPNLVGSPNIKSVDIFYPSDDSTIGLTINLKSSSSYKVFPLKEPGRIVIDTMPN